MSVVLAEVPPIYQRSHKVKAKVTIPESGAEGVIVAEGGGVLSIGEPLPSRDVQIELVLQAAAF